MQVTKNYKLGGFFGNSQDKFSHMAGAARGFDRKRLRELKRAKRKGESLSGRDAQDLQYMKAVRGDRIKKGIAIGALAGTAAIAGPAALTALKAKGLAGLAGKGATGAGKLGKLKSLFGKAKKVKGVIDQAQELKETLTPEQEQQIDEGNFGQPDQYGKYGMRVLKGKEGVKIPKKADVRSLLAALDNFSKEKKKREKRQATSINPMISDEKMNAQVLSALLERFKDSVPSITGPKATDRYYNR